MVLLKHGLPWDLFPRYSEEEVAFNMEMQRLRGPVPSWEVQSTTTNSETSVESTRPPINVPAEAYTALAILRAPNSLKSDESLEPRIDGRVDDEDEGCQDGICMSLSIERDWTTDSANTEDDDGYFLPKPEGQMKYRRLGEHPIIRNIRHVGRNIRKRCDLFSKTISKVMERRRVRSAIRRCSP